MNLNTFEAFESADDIGCTSAQGFSSSSKSADGFESHHPWNPEDIAEPEFWTLSSFDDLVPSERV